MNLHALQTVVFSRDGPACRELARWLADHKLDWRYSSGECGVDVARNQTVNRFLREDPPHKTHLLMIDADMVPVVETEGILKAAGEIVYCGYVGRYGSDGHLGDGDFGASCCRLSKNLLQRLGPPWFKMQVNAERTRRLGCECGHLRLRATQAGEHSMMVGIIGHAQRTILLPDTNGKRAYKVVWPAALED